MSRLVLGNLRIPARPVPPAAGERPMTGATAAERRGRMPVILTVHGGSSALADVMEGLVERNVRAIKTGTVPFASAVRLPNTGDRTWLDAPTALADGIGSAGTMAAWRAAEERVKAESLAVSGIRSPHARIALVNGVPAAVLVDESGRVRVIPPVGGTAQPMSVGAFSPAQFGLRNEARNYEIDEGPVQEQMLLTLDDDYALPVREINTAIARHNAHRIKKKGLPLLYESGVVYKTEGTPELWWDAEEILRNGHDDCFSAETSYLTPDGPKTFGSTVGTTQVVRTREGAWVEAPVLSGRTQRLWALTVARGERVETIFTTREHKWFVCGEADRQNTSDLHAGELLESHGPEWRVVSVCETERVEEVFCVVVQGSASFTLENGVCTSNCEGLGAYRAGELIAGADPSEFTGGPIDADVYTRYIPTPGGQGRLFHALTRAKIPDASVRGWHPEFDDPSVRLGMPCPLWYSSFMAEARRNGTL